jgi:hypothetical protein
MKNKELLLLLHGLWLEQKRLDENVSVESLERDLNSLRSIREETFDASLSGDSIGAQPGI